MDADEVRRLVEVARGGDEEAWERLYGHVYPRLRAYMFRRVGAEAVEDVVNETMARAVAGIGRFRWEPAGFDAWVFGIARRVAADHHRQAGRFRRAMRAADPTAGVAPEPGEALELGQDHAQIRALFSRLDPAEREVLELRVIGGLSSDEAAAALGKRAGAVRTAQSRALAHLRRLLADQP